MPGSPRSVPQRCEGSPGPFGHSFGTAHPDTSVGHAHALLPVTCTEVNGHPTVVTGSSDGTYVRGTQARDQVPHQATFALLDR